MCSRITFCRFYVCARECKSVCVCACMYVCVCVCLCVCVCARVCSVYSQGDICIVKQ